VIGLDTNILLRAMLDDHPTQSPAAQELLRSFQSGQRGFVNLPVLMEFFWVLRTHYKLPRQELVAALLELIGTETIEFEALQTVIQALALVETSGADFSDAIIGLRNSELGAETTVTFDRDAVRSVPAMELLA
jgi:predicted nucleic-acid-binding protein